jgi:outer membrane biosynthesis protein TonB
MASTKTPTKAAPAKRPAKTADATPAKAKPAPKTKVAAKPAPVAKPKPAPKATSKAAPKEAVAKPAKPRAKKPGGVPAEQRRNYIEMAAYYIAERRGFAAVAQVAAAVEGRIAVEQLRGSRPAAARRGGSRGAAPA